MKRSLLLTFAIALLGQITFAQDFDREKLDSYFEALRSNDRFMGSLAVSRNGEIIYTNSVGYCDLINGNQANEESKYRIGSISKTFTAVLTLLAVEQDKLQLGQTLDEFFPTVPNSDRITISHLLSHRSGIYNFTNDPSYLTWNTEPRSEEEMVEIISSTKSDFEPGSKAAYSNSNYVLLTYILENVFDQPYEVLLKEYITQPVGLKNTYLGGKINPENRECNSFRFATNWETEPETDISIPMGAGGIVSTPSDLVKFSDALFAGKILQKESLEKMKTIQDNFGMGLVRFPFHDKTALGHTGGIDGFSSSLGYFADGDISFAMVSNGTNYSNNDISIAVLSAVFGKSYDIPEFKTFEVNADDLDKYLGVYASSQLPLKITITQENGTLFGQATGQSAFPLEATDKDIFEFKQAGLVLEFNPSEESMVLKQGGGKFDFKKEK